MSASGASPIGRRISDSVNAVHRMAAASAPDLAELLKRSAETTVDRASIVVVGEAKRGKSSLVNALIGRPGLSPVAAAVATACPVVLTYSTPERAGVRLLDGEQIEVDLDELDQWVTGERAAQVLGVEVGLDVAMLSRFTVIDTPGIGGIIPAHTAMALGALSGATAVLFVCDPTAPLSRPELDFVAEVAKSVDTVLLALTKIDAHPHWRSLLDEDRALLAAAVPRLANSAIFPVSARLAARALTCDDPVEAAALRAEAGVEAIEKTLRATIAPRARALGAANTLRVALSVCEDLERRSADRAAATAADPELLRAAEAERLRLVELNRENSAWGSAVEHQLGLIRLDVLGDAGRRLGDARRRWDEVLAKGTVDDEDQLALAIAAEIADVDAAMRLVLVERMSGVATALLGGLVADGSLSTTLELLGRREEPRVVTPLPEGGAGVSGMDMLGAMGGFSMGRMLFATLLPSTAAGTVAAAISVPIAAVTGAFTVVPVVAGLAMMRLAKKWRGQAARRGELRVWSRAAFDEALADLRSGFERGVTEAKFALVSAMRATIARRIDEVSATIATHNEALKLDAAARNTARQAANQQLREVRDLATRTRRVLAELLEASARTPATAPRPAVAGVGVGEVVS